MVRLVSVALVAVAAAQDPDVYNRGPTTVKGCECASACDTSVYFNCDAAEFCKVKSEHCAHGTAQWSLSHGYYDYCEWPAYDTYESQTAAQKQALLLHKVAGDAHSGHYPSALGLGGLFGESVMTTFDAAADVFPESRTKYIHTVGVTGGIRWVSNGAHAYKGLFEGADHGIIRLSSAREPGSGGFVPGMGLKLLRDGRQSANFVAMYTLDGQTCQERDWFQHTWSNHIPLTDDFALQLVAKKFWQASYCPLQVGVSDFATTADGVPAARGSFPFQLVFKPLVHSDCDCTHYAECLQNLIKNIAVGAPIFEVLALATPGATPESIGRIELTSSLSTSLFGDQKLSFQHQHMEDDFAVHPEWLQQIDLKKECGMDCASTGKPSIDDGCSSPWNGNAMLESDVTV